MEFIIYWRQLEVGGKIEIGYQDIRNYPLPIGAEPIVTVDWEDVNITVKECRKKVRKGISLFKLRREYSDDFDKIYDLDEEQKRMLRNNSF